MVKLVSATSGAARLGAHPQPINQYETTFRIEPKDGAWKITQMNVERESPLSFTTRLRGIDADKPNAKDSGTTESTENTEGRKREE